MVTYGNTRTVSRRVQGGTDPLQRGLPSARAGQSMLETMLAMMIICLVFAGFFQISQILAAREVLQHSAARAARASTVGFNRWMVDKCTLAAAIPNSGRLLQPAFTNVNLALQNLVAQLRPGELWSSLLGTVPDSAQAQLELARIPEFLASENYARSRFILDYANWQNGSIWHTVSSSAGTPGGAVNPTLDVTVGQDFPLTVPLHRAFYAADVVELKGESWLEDHHPLYLEDWNL